MKSDTKKLYPLTSLQLKQLRSGDWRKSEGLIGILDNERLNLGGVDLRVADLSGANLSNCNLSGANLMCSNLKGANLSGAVLENTDLRKCNLKGANLCDVKCLYCCSIGGVKYTHDIYQNYLLGPHDSIEITYIPKQDTVFFKKFTGTLQEFTEEAKDLRSSGDETDKLFKTVIDYFKKQIDIRSQYEIRY